MKIFVSTGEASGDLHLSYIVEALKKEDPTVELYGVAGEHSRKAGVEVIQDIQDLAVMGFMEALKKYSFLKGKMEEYLDFIEENGIEKVFMVDYGGFHLKFLKALKERLPEVKVYYYIPPKIWVWGKGRLKTLRLADAIMVIFPWEVEFYKKEGVDVIYYGNPLAEENKPRTKAGDKILLLPGSRRQEISSVIDMYFALVAAKPERQFVMKLASEEALQFFPENWESYPNLELCLESSLEELVEEASLALAVSGTVTLELALLGCPCIVVYKTSAFNYLVAKYLLKVGYISLPNLCLGEEVFPELIQGDCNLEKVEKEIYRIESEPGKMQEKLREIRATLSGKNIIEQYANFLLKGEL